MRVAPPMLPVATIGTPAVGVAPTSMTSAASPHTCPPPSQGPPPPPAPVPPGAPRDFAGMRVGRTTGAWWRFGDEFALRLGTRLGEPTGYGTWTDAVTAASAASAGRAGSVAICDDRGRLYLYTVVTGCAWGPARPVQLGTRRETGYAFEGTAVRGLVDGDRIASRGDCLHPWVPVPPLPAR